MNQISISFTGYSKIWQGGNTPPRFASENHTKNSLHEISIYNNQDNIYSDPLKIRIVFTAIHSKQIGKFLFLHSYILAINSTVNSTINCNVNIFSNSI